MFVLLFIIIMILRAEAFSFGRSTYMLRHVQRNFHAASRVSMTAAASSVASPMKGPVPITVLSGFLGAGKTTFLSNTLANRNGVKFGLVVNDMATVNVDAKQIRSQTSDPFGGIDTMELQDGCVCCTLAEDLIASVSKLISLSDLKGEKYDHIVVECSGIAEPRKIRDLFQQAEDYKLDLLKKVRLDTLITLVDASVFMQLFGSEEAIATNKHLAYKEGQKQPPQDPNDENTYIDLDGSDQRKVTDLLLEQVECSDIVMINKCDLLASPSEIELVKKVIASVNPMARVVTCVNGIVPNPLSLVGSANAKGAADWGILDEHRKLIKAVEDSHKSVQSVDEHHTHTEQECTTKGCRDPSHNHDHKHIHAHTHEHKHEHEHKHDCHDLTCTDSSHRHDHKHEHEHDCHDHACTDPSHKHDHSHSHSHGHAHDNADMTTAQERFGITSFVYRRRRPFHPIRFSMFLHSLGKLSIKGVSELSALNSAPAESTRNSGSGSSGNSVASDAGGNDLLKAKRALLRSKGFVWMGTSAQAAYFMSHAGQFLDLLVLGRWWAAIDKADWPKGVESDLTVDFEGEHGDRRQELVFIGQFGKDNGRSQHALEEVLDECLLTNEEMMDYNKVALQGDDALRSHFAPGH